MNKEIKTIHDIVELFKEARKQNDEQKLKECFDALWEMQTERYSIINVGRSKDITDVSRKIINGAFIVRLYDGFDNEWIDVSKPLPYEEALEIWSKKTNGGTENTTYNNIDYYAIFSEETTMLHSHPSGRWDGK